MESKFPPEFEPVLSLLASYDSQTLDVERDKALIDRACEIVRQHQDDRKVCKPVHPTDLGPGMAVCFHYRKFDVNEPWRFGVVVEFVSGVWRIFTFTLKKEKRRTGSGTYRIVKGRPNFRSYNLSQMRRVRRVLAPSARTDPTVSSELVRLGQEMVRLGQQVKGLLGPDALPEKR